MEHIARADQVEANLFEVGSEDHVPQSQRQSLARYTERVRHGSHGDSGADADDKEHHRPEKRLVLVLVQRPGKHLSTNVA